MWFIPKKKLEFKGLEEKLKNCCEVSLPEEKKQQMKKNIFAAIAEKSPAQAFGFGLLVEKIREVAEAIRPSEYFRVLLKEKLITLVEFHTENITRRFFPLSKFSRKMLAGVTAFVFVFVMLFNLDFGVKKAQAAALTILEYASGEVSVIRSGNVIFGENGFLLKTDDVIKTGPASKAVIRFLDQSVSRLDENTEIKISRLFINPVNKTQTIVELILNRGMLWSRVINLIDNYSHFQVKAKNTVAVAKKKAAFNVAVLPQDKAKVVAVQNKIDIKIATDKNVVETTLAKGFTAEVKTASSGAASPIISIDGRGSEKEKQWVADNLQQDQQYIENVKHEVQDQAKDQVSVLPGNPLYAVKEISENTKIAFTMDEVSRQQKIIDSIAGKLAETQVLFERGEREKAQIQLDDAKRQLDSVVAWIDANEASSPATVVDLRAKINQILNFYQKSLSLMLPKDPLYVFKDVIAQMQVQVASDEVIKTEQKLSQAGDKLLEAHDLVEKGEDKLAAEKVQEYSDSMSKVVSDIKDLPSDEKEKAVNAILDSKVEDIKTLNSIAAPIVTVKDVSGDQQSPTDTPVVILTPESFSNSTSTILLTDPQAIAPVTAGATTTASVPGIETPAEVKTLPAVELSAVQTELKDTLSSAKAETLVKLGEAVLELQKDQQSNVEVLSKIKDVNSVDVNGKPVLNVRLGKDKVFIRSEGKTISVDSNSENTAELRQAAPETEILPNNTVQQSMPASDSKTSESDQKLP